MEADASVFLNNDATKNVSDITKNMLKNNNTKLNKINDIAGIREILLPL